MNKRLIFGFWGPKKRVTNSVNKNIPYKFIKGRRLY